MGYFQLIQRVVTEFGVPLAVYHDGHAVFERSEYEPESVEEQLVRATFSLDNNSSNF